MFDENSDERKIVSKLIGLMGAVGNYGGNEEAAEATLDATLYMAGIKLTELEELLYKIESARSTIAPGCKGCKTPCGNTDDFDFKKFDASLPETKEARVKMLTGFFRAVEERYGNSLDKSLKNLTAEMSDIIPDLYKAYTWFAYELDPNDYMSLLHGQM